MKDNIFQLVSQGLNTTEIQAELSKMGINTSIGNIRFIIRHQLDTMPEEIATKRRHKSTKTPQKTNR